MNDIHKTIRAIDPLLEKADRVLADKQYNHMGEKLKHMVNTMNLIKDLEDHTNNILSLTQRLLSKIDSSLLEVLIEHISKTGGLIMILIQKRNSIVLSA